MLRFMHGIWPGAELTAGLTALTSARCYYEPLRKNGSQNFRKESAGMTTRITVCLSLIVVLFTATSARVFADEPPTDEPVTSEYTARAESSSGIFSQLHAALSSTAASGSPSKCKQSAYTPRQSGSKVRGKIRGSCKNRVPRMRHTAELLRWQGWTGGGWRAIGNVGAYDKKNTSSGSAYGTTPCTKHKFKVTGEGYVIDVDNVKYLTGTTSRIGNNPCDLD